ncbi:hypothetical protein NHP190003_06630 [Helicobacter sp. NHP19-003]|uniref:Uncharacterized protein n=1 Tax=Helicobacter gastrocanis TaxID=2849641 RepID=A0ABN6I1B6_9HELI|nr:hypothetical protein [Helicobacter sp. NHP19-003]BCZ17381.1 hypothetical protein NHP190003_06630 [Helicobacter sp. NHP19-003]
MEQSQRSPEQVYMSRYAKDLAFENLFKNFIFFVVFVITAMVSVSVWLLPKISDYRSQDLEARQQATIVAYYRKDFVGTLKDYETLEQNNISLLKHPDYTMATNNLNTLLRQHFTHIKIQEKSSRIDPLERFIHDELRVNVQAHSLSDFYAFFDGLAAISAYTQIEFPITITKNKHTFILDFGMHVDYKVMKR